MDTEGVERFYAWGTTAPNRVIPRVGLIQQNVIQDGLALVHEFVEIVYRKGARTGDIRGLCR